MKAKQTPRYRRAKHPGGTFSLPWQTYPRNHLFDQEEARRILREVIQRVRKAHPFTIDARVLLPNHMHCVWILPEGDDGFSMQWNLIKSLFSKEATTLYHVSEWMNDSKRSHKETTIRQRRFWEHQIRDGADYRAHIDYVHFNPVKHGLVRGVSHWPFSTFHRYVRLGIYPEDWGGEADDKVYCEQLRYRSSAR
jgi:putative transposase